MTRLIAAIVLITVIGNGLLTTALQRAGVGSAERVKLGETLFFDKRLSADGTVSCATCHDPA